MLDPLIEAANPDELKLSMAFTQYLRPDGRSRIMRFDVVGDLAVMAKGVTDAGLRFECEILSTDEVSLTVFNNELGENIAIEICPNGPEVLNAIARLIRSAAKHIEMEAFDKDID